MQFQKHQLTELLEIATENGKFYEQTDGVSLGPLLANFFMCPRAL